MEWKQWDTHQKTQIWIIQAWRHDCGVCPKGFFRLVLLWVFEEFPQFPRYANGEVGSAPAVNGTSRLRCTNRRQGQTSGGSGGYLSLLSQESWQRRWIKLASTGIYKHRESVSQSQAGSGSAAKLCCVLQPFWGELLRIFFFGEVSFF